MKVLRRIGWTMIILTLALLGAGFAIVAGMPASSGQFGAYLLLPLVIGIKALVVVFIIGVVLADLPHGDKQRSSLGASAIFALIALAILLPMSNSGFRAVLWLGTSWIPYAAAVAVLLLHVGTRKRVFRDTGNARLDIAWGVFQVCCFGLLVNGVIAMTAIADRIVVHGLAYQVFLISLSMLAAGYALYRRNPISPFMIAVIMMSRIDIVLIPHILGRFLGGDLNGILPLVTLGASATCAWLLLDPILKSKAEAAREKKTARQHSA